MAQGANEVTRRPPGLGTPALAVKAPSSAVTTEEIRSHIVETRAKMTEMIDAIQERVGPGHRMTYMKETVDATVGRMKHLVRNVSDTAGGFARQTSGVRAGIVHRIKNNPAPVVLAGVAAAWLLVRALRRRRT